MTDDERGEMPRPSDSESRRVPESDEQSRRAFLLRLARGATYSAPIIHTFAAPPAAAAQASGPMMMLTLCDYFPILCRWLGGNETTTFTVDQTLPPGTPLPPGTELPTAPWAEPPPWSRSAM